MAAVIFPLVRGVSVGTGITDLKRIEDSVRAGRNALLTAVTQSTQVHYATTLGNAALEAGGYEPVPVGARMVGYLAPPILAFFVKQGIGITCLRKVALFIQDNIGLLCQIAAAVSAVALIIFGHLALGIASLVIVGVGFLDRLALLPECIRHPLHEYSPVVRIATGLVVGDLLEKLFALLSLVTYCYEKMMNCGEKQVEEVTASPAPPRERLDFAKLRQILNNEVRLEINPYHISLDTMAAAPNVNPQDLLPLFDAIDWPRHLPALRQKFSRDLRFLELCGKVEGNSDEELVAQARTDLQTYIDEAMNRQITNGEIHDYDRLQTYLKIITNELLESDDDVVKSDALIRLAIEGGGHCGPGKMHVAEELYAELAMPSGFISPELKLLLRLQDARTLWFQAKYASILQIVNDNPSCCMQLMRWIFDFQDLHLYNIFLNLHGNSMGLRKASADNDHVAIIDPLTKSTVRSFTEQIKESFKQWYGGEEAIEQIREGVGSSTLPRHNLFDWWADWIHRQEGSEEEKTLLLEELQNQGSICGHHLQEGDPLTPGAFSPAFLRAMSFDIGILKSHTESVPQ